MQERLESGVIRVVLNQWAFAAVKSDKTVVVWGRKSYGGSTFPPPESSYWKPQDIRNVIPESLTSTCCAFGFIREVGHQSNVAEVSGRMGLELLGERRSLEVDSSELMRR